MDTAFQFLADIWQFFISLLPSKQLIEPTELGIKYKPSLFRWRTLVAVVLYPGNHWYWSWTSAFYSAPVVWQTLPLGNIPIVTQDNKQVTLRAAVAYRVVDLLKAQTKNHEYDQTVDDICRSTFVTIGAHHRKSTLSKLLRKDEGKERSPLEQEVMDSVQQELCNRVGVEILACYIGGIAVEVDITHHLSGIPVAEDGENE